MVVVGGGGWWVLVGGGGGVPSDYLVSTQLQFWLFCCWGCGCCWAVTICDWNVNVFIVNSYNINLLV